MPEEIYWLWLSMALGVCSDTAQIILEHEIWPERIYGMDCHMLRALGIFTPEQCQRIHEQKLDEAKELYRYCQKQGYQIITIADSRYPRRLLALPDFPLVLYVQGNAELLKEMVRQPVLSVVGTRNFTRYGAQVTEMM